MNSPNPLKKEFRVLERNVLILTAVPLPPFAFAYLYTTGGSMSLDLPELPTYLSSGMLGAAIGLLVWQVLAFNQQVRRIRMQETSILTRLRAYSTASIHRFWMLFAVGFLSAVGLLFSERPGFTITYAVCLLFVSLGKPTPDRIAKGLRLKGEDKEQVYDINRRDP
ncbi:MAG: hypothetical protein JJU34_03325 [Lunatimonas sp.]|uniref:hypothetical protein n=1 Tax=Lunatimonas sp. TaxID=2060141 RepID=UPI00263B8041|nr:hypothetical protein [Lunatimonas sp.]MCC5936293.1 hypothetical protein [Lunatimonas sp.]